MGELTAEDRAALDAWWHSDWPDDGGDVLDTLAEAVERILAAHGEALAGKVRALTDEWAQTHGATEAYCADRLRALLDAEATGEQP